MQVNTATKKRFKTKQEDDNNEIISNRRKYTIKAVNLGHLQSDIYTTITIKGENFELEREDGMFYISHPLWSLVGMGKDVTKAVSSLFENAKIKADYYCNTEDSSLSEEAIKFKTYLSIMLS